MIDASQSSVFGHLHHKQLGPLSVTEMVYWSRNVIWKSGRGQFGVSCKNGMWEI